MRIFARASLFFAVFLFLVASVAHAQKQFPPPQGMGRVVALASGLSGPGHYMEAAAKDYEDAFQRMADALKMYLSN